MTSPTDIPALTFVNPGEMVVTYRACLWAAGGQGKSVAAASAPPPILVLTADRPTAYMFARKHHGLSATDLREVRYEGPETLDAVYLYVKQNQGTPDAIRTLIVDPVGNIVDHLRDVAPKASDGDIDFQWVNKKVLGFVKSLRPFDVNVVLVAHEKLNDGKRGDGKLYPALGGGTLINKLIAEMDIVAHMERHVSANEESGEETIRWVGQLQPRGNLVCKEGLGCLGDRRIADLSRWFEVATESLAPDDPAPWEPGYSEEDTTGDYDTASAEDEQATLDGAAT